MRKTILMEPEERLEKMDKLAKELILVMANLRFYGKYWHEHYGAENRLAMQRWESRADKLLAEMGVNGVLKQGYVVIKFGGEEDTDHNTETTAEISQF